MCGIFGILANSLPQSTIIREALNSIKHRGPDDEGYVFSNIADNSAVRLLGADRIGNLRKVVLTFWTWIQAASMLSWGIEGLPSSGYHPQDISP